MSTIGDKRTASLAAARTQRDELQTQLVNQGLDANLVAVVVPVGFVVTVQEATGTANTTEQNRTLATDNGLELYEPS